MPFQPGNSYGQSRRVVEGELRKLIHAKPGRLRRALDQCIEDAGDPEVAPTHRLACLSFIADRLDGRARQAIEVTSDAPRELQLGDLVAAVLAARSADATDTPTRTLPDPASADSALPPPTEPAPR